MPVFPVRFPVLGVAASLVLAVAARAAAAPPTPDEAAQAYVQGRLALASEAFDVAADRFGLAMRAGADDGLKRRALDVALISGDTRAAVALANRIALPESSEPGRAVGDSLVALTRAIGAAAARDWRAYEAARLAFSAPGRSGSGGQLLGTLLEAYGRAGRGDMDGALALLDAGTAAGIAASYRAEHRAHLLAMAKRWPEAAEAYAAIVAAEGATVSRLRLAAAAAALEAGAKDPAWRARGIATLGDGPERDPMLVDARARLAADPGMSGRALGGLPTRPQQGLALMLLRVATDLARERATAPAVSFARLATHVDPDLPDGWLVVSDMLARAGRPGLALDALQAVPGKRPWAELADARRASLLAASGDHEAAANVARRMAERPDAGPEDWSRLADIARRAGRNADAAAYYGRALALLPVVPGPQHAQLWFLRGSANEVAGNWDAAEADLRRAVEAQPDNSVYLNYLGYSLLDRRLKLEEARALIARAYKAAPENGAIIDSMGWAEYVAGNYAQAVVLLEKARAAEPADPTIADHLGDALWKAGRRIEARHAWTSAVTLAPPDALAAMLAKKLEFGLDVALASR
jgi:tetratricopeptide (TPR) repeat protein